jgi:hypothetical protein
MPIPDLSAAAHVALSAATIVPGLGTAAAVADAGLYAYEGDYPNAALSLVAAVPGGSLLSAGEKAFKLTRDLDKAANVVNEGEKAFKAIDKAESAVNDLNRVAKATKNGFGGLSEAENYGIQRYSSLRSSLKDTQLEAHHPVERRLAKRLHLDPDQMSVAVTRAEHQAFTNAWRREIGYGVGTASAARATVEAAAQRICSGYPPILGRFDTEVSRCRYFTA